MPAANKARDEWRHGQSVRNVVWDRQRRGDVVDLASYLRIEERELEAGLSCHEAADGIASHSDGLTRVANGEHELALDGVVIQLEGHTVVGHEHALPRTRVTRLVPNLHVAPLWLDECIAHLG